MISHYTRLGVKNHESYYLAKKKFRNFNAALTIYNDETPLISLLISFLSTGVTATSLVINSKQKTPVIKKCILIIPESILERVVFTNIDTVVIKKQNQ